MNISPIAAGALVLAILVGSYAGGDGGSRGPASASAIVKSAVGSTAAAGPGSAAVVTASESEAASTSDPDNGLSPLAQLVRPAGDLRFDADAGTSAAQPVWLSIESIGVVVAGISDVGVQANGEMAIPGAREIGWYRWSPSPGQDGSAVLAAHIAYNGIDGVFRHLGDVDVGALVTIGYDDGSLREFEIIELSQYRKEELPFDRIFAKDGEPVVALITCGGTFNRELRSYDENVVAYAVPT